MRVLALDYGSARCGCALSDPTGTLATPLPSIANPSSRRGMAELQTLVRKREVQHVVVGLPLSLRGQDTEQTQKARSFATALTQTLGSDVPVELHDERFTTKMAQRIPGTRAGEDSIAAALLLESWLEAHPG
jgi:putative Holliday junction resolvase